MKTYFIFSGLTSAIFFSYILLGSKERVSLLYLLGAALVGFFFGSVMFPILVLLGLHQIKIK